MLQHFVVRREIGRSGDGRHSRPLAAPNELRKTVRRWWNEKKIDFKFDEFGNFSCNCG
jgi:hypothetical protein